MKTIHEPRMSVRYPEDPFDTYGAAAAEQVWIGAFPRQWLRNLKAATLETDDIEGLRQIVAELIHVLLESMDGDALKWPL